MIIAVRLILVVVLAVSLVSSVAHAAGTADMAAAMITSNDAATAMSDCNACDDAAAGEMGLACDLVCGAGSFTAVIASQAYCIVSSPREALGPAVTKDFCGFSSPPAKHPPRTLI